MKKKFRTNSRASSSPFVKWGRLAGWLLIVTGIVIVLLGPLWGFIVIGSGIGVLLVRRRLK